MLYKIVDRVLVFVAEYPIVSLFGLWMTLQGISDIVKAVVGR